MKFSSPTKYKQNEHIDVLAMPKPQYHGKDFFQRADFRGLLLADYQQALGDKAFECVQSLNKDTVSKFGQLKSFKDSLNQKKKLENFYKTVQKPPVNIKSALIEIKEAPVNLNDIRRST